MMQVFLYLQGVLKLFFQIWTEKKYEDSVSGNSVPSNYIIKMKKQRLANANNTIIGP